MYPSIVELYNPAEITKYYHVCGVCRRVWGHPGCSMSRVSRVNLPCPMCNNDQHRSVAWAFEDTPYFPGTNPNRVDGWW